MIPKIFQSPMTNLWYIATNYKEHEGFVETKTKHEVPPIVIEEIAWDFLLREQMCGYDKGYSINVNTKKGKFKVTVEKTE